MPPPAATGMFCPNPIPHHESPPPLRLSDRRTRFMRSFSLRNGRNASAPCQPPRRDLQKRPGLNESVRLRVPFQSATKTSQMSSLKKPLPISPLIRHGTTPYTSILMPNSPDGGHSPSPLHNRKSLMHSSER